MVAGNLWVYAATAAAGLVVVRLLMYWTLLGSGVRRLWGWVEEICDVYQWYRIPERNENMQENQLYRKVSLYVNSLTSLEESDFANLVTGRKSGEILLRPEPGQAVADSFLGARISWRSEAEPASFLLRVRRRDRRRVLRPYLQHVHAVVDEIEAKRKEARLFTNSGGGDGEGRWRSVPFTHPATMETVAMDPEVKGKVKTDMETFLKSKQYYHRLGRVWKRSYLLHGPAGTGKTTFVAAMAKFLGYDVYDVDLARVRDDSDLKTLLIQTSPKSLILIEDVDRFLASSGGGPPAVTLAGVLGFADGIFACCGEERVMVFTMGSRDGVDPALLRPGRLDVHVHFPACDFPAFKVMASSYLGVKEHKLFAAAEEAFAAAPAMSQAEIGEILILHRGSPSRAIKSVISAMQARKAAGWRMPDSGSRREGRSGDDSCDEGVVVCGGGGGAGAGSGWELKKLYGLLRVRSRRGSELLEPAKDLAA